LPKMRQESVREMNFADLQRVVEYVNLNSPHECGHIIVLFKAGRLKGLNFLPHEVAADGVKGVIETAPVNELGKEDCVGLAAGIIGELIGRGQYDPRTLLDDRKKVQDLVSQPLENFALEAYEIIRQNLLFFVLLNIEVGKKMFATLKNAYFSLSDEDYAKLPHEVPIFTLAEVEEVHSRAESTLAGFRDERKNAP
jgi:hypothetical protein